MSRESFVNVKKLIENVSALSVAFIVNVRKMVQSLQSIFIN